MQPGHPLIPPPSRLQALRPSPLPVLARGGCTPFTLSVMETRLPAPLTTSTQRGTSTPSKACIPTTGGSLEKSQTWE